MNHGPDGEAGGEAVNDGQEPAEERDIRACGFDAEEAQAAYHGRSKDAERNQRADLQEDTDEHIRRVGAKVRHDHVRRFPGTGPPGRTNTERDAECADGGKAGVEENGVDDRQRSEVRSTVLKSG